MGRSKSLPAPVGAGRPQVRRPSKHLQVSVVGTDQPEVQRALGVDMIPAQMATATAPVPPNPVVPGPPAPRPEGWSAGALATLAAVGETIVHGGAERRARLAAAALDRAADPAQVCQLRLVLVAFESRAANLLLTGRPIRFSDLDQPAREAYLLAWRPRGTRSAGRPTRVSSACSRSSPTRIPARRASTPASRRSVSTSCPSR